MTYLGYHLHWELDTLLQLAHADRSRFALNVSALNERAWDEIRSMV